MSRGGGKCAHSARGWRAGGEIHPARLVTDMARRSVDVSR